ncbi:hypothetical protein Nepgr_025381 [Nepenthes gracilis]|uniref:Uncharacterized protein n=1 Tax=Nepenthes gracilis TaxID=150966 RepID=A0AAD3T4M7_NEPGR|nr:hypothetical protein Nepgr_025381 [Nepenthes gracilis]
MIRCNGVHSASCLDVQTGLHKCFCRNGFCWREMSIPVLLSWIPVWFEMACPVWNPSKSALVVPFPGMLMPWGFSLADVDCMRLPFAGSDGWDSNVDADHAGSKVEITGCCSIF